MLKTAKASLLLIGLVTVLPFTTSWALASDKQQAVYIKADKVSLNHASGIGTYEGNVEITQGTTRLTADKVITQVNKQNQLQEVTAIGKLAEYRTLPEPGKPELIAKAETIKYMPIQSKVTLTGNAIASQGKDSYQGPVIYYDIQQQIITSPESKQGRTTIIIQPRPQTTTTNQ